MMDSLFKNKAYQYHLKLLNELQKALANTDSPNKIRVLKGGINFHRKQLNIIQNEFGSHTDQNSTDKE